MILQITRAPDFPFQPISKQEQKAKMKNRDKQTTNKKTVDES